MAAIPYWTLAAVGALAMVALAAGILALRPRDTAVRLFAAFLVVRALNGLTGTLTVDRDAFIAANASVYNFALDVVAGTLILSFLLYHPRPLWSARIRVIAIVVMLGGALLAALLMLRDPAIAAVLVPREGGGLRIGGAGPMYAIGGLFFLACGIAAVRFAWTASRTTGDARSGWTFLYLAFALDAVFVSFYRVTSYFDSPVSEAPSGVLRYAVLLVSGLAALLAWLPLRLSARSPVERRESTIAAALLALALVSGLANNAYVETLPLDARLGESVTLAVRALWRFPLPILAAYALVRHSLFDIDVRIKWGIRQGTLAAIVIGVIFVVSESAAAFFEESIGPYAGIVAAGLLVFALAPLQRVAERVADAAMPRTRALHADPDAEGAYRTALELALADGVITRVEERALARLQGQLRLDPERALALREEAEAMRAGGPAGPSTTSGAP